MASSTDCGINSALFQMKVPEVLLCKICHLVLREPLKFVTCGHMFCKKCLHRYRMLAQKHQQPLVCPVDHKVIQNHQTVCDEESENLIANLVINCPNKIRACKWSGSYKDLEEHFTKCERKEWVQQLFDRVERLEVTLVEKEKENNFLKNTHEIQLSYKLRTKLTKQVQENEDIKVKVYETNLKVEDMEVKLNETKQENEEIKEKLNNANEKVEDMEVQLNKTKKENEEMKEKLNKSNKQVEDMEEKMTEMSIRLEKVEQKERKEENGDLKNELETLKKTTKNEISLLKECQISSNSITTDMLITKQPQVYLDFSSGDSLIGRVIIDLYYTDAPQSCKKFINLITSQPGWGYSRAKIDRIHPKFFRVGIDLIDEAVSNGYSTSEIKTPLENLSAKHDAEGLVSLVDYGVATKTAFIIMYQPYPSYDGSHVIIGKITKDSWWVAQKVREVPLGDYKGRLTNEIFKEQAPLQELKIAGCGVLI